MTPRDAAIPGKWNAVRIAAFLRVAAFAPIVLGCFYLLFYLPSAPAIAVIDARVQSVTFEVSVPEMAQIQLEGFALFYEASETRANLGFQSKTIAPPKGPQPFCLTGVLIPEPGAMITYKRYGKNPVSVIIQRSDGKPTASFDIRTGDLPTQARAASWIRLESHGEQASHFKEKTCDGESSSLLPIYGVADLGTEMRPAGRDREPSSGLLISGKLDIFAKTIDPSAIGEGATSIYPASTSSITLPPGSRITEYVADGITRQPWAGFALIDGDTALTVKVSTPASKLAIIRPGLGLKPEILAIGLFTQLIHDPMLVWAQIVVAFLFSALQMLSTALSLFSTKLSKSPSSDKEI